MPENKIFTDTNVIIYAYDISAGQKHEIAKGIIMDLWNSGLGVLSTQVLQEFFVTVTRKIKKPLDIQAAKRIVHDLTKWDLVVVDGETILGAIDVHHEYRYSFWDSMVIQAAMTAGATLLLSEDLSDGQTIAGVKIHNPFTQKS